MYSRFHSITTLLLCVAMCAHLNACASSESMPRKQLRVCADPNNLPFSNDKLEGFENAIAAMLATHLNAELSYTWWAQRRGFIRNTLKACSCDVIMGLPSSMEMVRTTSPYYRSSYVFLSKKADDITMSTLDDSALRRLRVGVHMIGDDQTNAPPAHALARRGIIENVRGYSLYGDYAQPNPPARIIDALASDELDIAIVWGPLAGYFASRSPVELTMTRVQPEIDLPYLPFVYDISMAVRREDHALASELESFLSVSRTRIDSLLEAFSIPTLPLDHTRRVSTR